MRVTASVFCSSIRPERRDFAESFATEVIPLRSGRHNLEKIGRRGWKPRAIKAKSKRRTRVSDPHVTSRGRGRPRHIFIMRSSSLLGSWVRAGRFPAPCAEAMARRVVLVEADRGCARGFDKVLGRQHGGFPFWGILVAGRILVDLTFGIRDHGCVS